MIPEVYSGFVGTTGGPTTIFASPDAGPGDSTFACGINNSGTIVGFTFTSGGVFESYTRSSGGVFTPITLPGVTNPCAHGIDNAGDIVGSCFSGNSKGFLLASGGAFTAINVPGSVYSVATGINNSGQIIGWYIDSITTSGFLYQISGSTFTTISVGPQTYPLGVNGSGVPYTIPGGTPTTISVGPQTYPLGINDSGYIVGVVSGPTGTQGFIRSPAGSVEIFAIPSSNFTIATCISNSGVVTGYYQYSDGNQWDSFSLALFQFTTNWATPSLYTFNTFNYDQPSYPYYTTSYLNPQAINDSGQIAGTINIAY